MKTQRKIGPAALTGLLASVILCGAVWFGRGRIWPVGSNDDQGLGALQADQAGLAKFDDATKAKLQQQAKGQVPAQCGEAELAALLARLGPNWACAPVAGSPGRERRFSLSFLPDDPRRWPTCLDGLALVEQQPGLVIETLEISCHNAAVLRVRLQFRTGAGRAPANAERGASLFPRSPLRGEANPGPAAAEASARGGTAFAAFVRSASPGRGVI